MAILAKSLNFCAPPVRPRRSERQMAPQNTVRISELPRLGAISFFDQIGPNLAQVTFGPMSTISPIKKLIQKFCQNYGNSNVLVFSWNQTFSSNQVHYFYKSCIWNMIFSLNWIRMKILTSNQMYSVQCRNYRILLLRVLIKNYVKSTLSDQNVFDFKWEWMQALRNGKQKLYYYKWCFLYSKLIWRNFYILKLCRIFNNSLKSIHWWKGCVFHSVEKLEIYSERKDISSNQLYCNFFSKNVGFTKFLQRKRKSKFS